MKKFLGLLLISSFFLKSNAQTTEPNYKFYKLTSLNSTVSSELKIKIINTYFSTDNILNINSDYDVDNMQIGYFDSSDIQAVYIKGTNANSRKTIVIYVKGNLVSDMAMKIDETTDVNRETIMLVKDRVGEIVTNIKVNSDGAISAKNNEAWTPPADDLGYMNETNLFLVKGGPSAKSLNLRSFWDRWTACVSTGLSQLFGGNHGVYVMIGGLWCVASGPYCAAGAVVGCAAHAAIFQ